MRQLTSEATQALQVLAQRYGVSLDAATSLLFAVNAGGGTMAQFNIPELGGSGQWMQGGMTMVGDMFNYGLQSKVSGICTELSNLLRRGNVFEAQPAPGGGQSQQQRSGAAGSGSSASRWWPAELGQPSASGGQNDARYAYFPHVQRLAIERGGQVTVYDTLDHRIGGVQQQQGGPYGSLSFSSQHGTFTVDSLPVAGGGGQQAAAPAVNSVGYTSQLPNQPEQAPLASFQAQPRTQQELLTALERLGDLYHKGILSEAEFQSKKSELLSRI